MFDTEDGGSLPNRPDTDMVLAVTPNRLSDRKANIMMLMLRPSRMW
jgi:hypothetical protein